MDNLIITPKTKVLQMIEAYPQLEDVLIGYVPAFKKLKNPVLRKTVGKIATLQQAASIGEVKVENLINHLRKEIEQDLFTDSASGTYNTIKPNWFAIEKIVKEFDAKDMLARGEYPVNQVIADINHMENGKIYKLIAPFLTAPLIDKAASLNCNHWVEKISEEHFHIYFYKD